MLALTLRDTLEDHRAGWPLVRERIQDGWLDDVADTLQIKSGWSMFSGSLRCSYYAVPAQLRTDGGWIDLYRVRNVHGEVPHWEPNVTRPSAQMSHVMWEGNLAYTASYSQSNHGGPCAFLTDFYCREYPAVQRVTVLLFDSPDEGEGRVICDREC